MSELNDDKKVNDLIEVLLLAGKKPVKVKVLSDGEFQLILDGVPYAFRADFDVVTGYWYLEN